MQQEMITPITQQNVQDDKPKQKILVAIFLEVFLGFFRDIALSVWNFFKQYFLLLWFYIRFIANPNADDYEKQREKTLHYSKNTFELILILTGILIFCIKQGWIQSESQSKVEVYNNDIGHWMMQAMLFLVYAACYFVVLFLLVLLGRLLRKIFKPIESSRVTDVVFIHLNNIFFITGAICSFIVRFDNVGSDFMGEDKEYELQYFMIALFNTFGIVFAAIMFVFFIRLTMINRLPVLKSVLYITLVPAVIWGFLFLCEIFITAFIALL